MARSPKQQSPLLRQLVATINDIPVEILLEICQYLEPNDIVHLTRTNAFLCLLLRHNSRIWKIARRNMGPDFPDCPLDISELQYAIYMFGNRCMICGAPSRSKYNEQNPFLSIRAPTKCLQSTLIKSSELGALEAQIANVSPQFGLQNSSLTPVLYSTRILGGSGQSSEKWFDRLQVLKLQTQLSQGDGLAAKARILNEWAVRLVISKWNAEAINNWTWKHKNQLSITERAICQARRNSIIEKLHQIDGLDTVYIDRFMTKKYNRHYMRLVDQPYPLTDEVWKKIGPQLIQLLRPLPETRRKKPRMKW